jgi:hypothetical protein
MDIIAFAGAKGSGKDTAALALPLHTNVKFAGALKSMLEALLRYQGCPEPMIVRYIEGDLKASPCPYLCGRTMRLAMQTLGTEWGRQTMADNFWLAAVENHIDNLELRRVVITDVRFPNEVAFVQAKGGRVLKVERPMLHGIIDNHASETGIATLSCDGVIANDGTVEDLHERVLDTVSGEVA